MVVDDVVCLLCLQRQQRMVRTQSEREKRAALTIESYYTRYREVRRRGSGRGQCGSGDKQMEDSGRYVHTKVQMRQREPESEDKQDQVTNSQTETQ